MGKQKGDKGKNTAEPAYINDIEDVQQNPAFRRYCGAEMIAQLKRLALDPCKPQSQLDNFKPLLDQILRFKTYMRLNDSHINLRKRKFQNSIKSIGADKYSDDKTLLESRNLSSLTFEETLSKNKELQYSLFDNAINWSCFSKDLSSLVDSDEPESCSKPSSLKKLKSPKGVTDVFCNDSKPSNRKNLRSNTQTSKPLQPLGPTWLQSIIDEYDIHKNVVPVGPRFQTDVPEWNDSEDKVTLTAAYNSDSDMTRWLGTTIWPIESPKVKTSKRKVGQGRPNSCRCASPGSVDCVKKHILEERRLLQIDLGSAFFSWNFNDMGDQVLQSWTVKEREIFGSIVENRPNNDENNFLKRALKHLRNKCRSEIISYYFNVYIPERISIQARSSSPVQIDTDEDEDNHKYLGVMKRATGKTLALSKSEGEKSRYLRLASS